jgi:hypothetical protein
LDSKSTIQIGSGRERRDAGGAPADSRLSATNSAVAPSPEKAKARFTALSRERKTPGWRGEQGELTMVRTEDKIGPEKVRCLEWRTVVLVVARLEGYDSPKEME